MQSPPFNIAPVRGPDVKLYKNFAWWSKDSQCGFSFTWTICRCALQVYITKLKKKGCAFSFLEIRVGRCLPNWHRTMSTVKHRDGRWHRGWGLGVCPKHESICRKTRKKINMFYGATKAAVLNSSPRVSPALHILHVSLLTHQLVRSELRAWTVLRLTWSAAEKCNLEKISCLLKLWHGPYTGSIAPYSLSREIRWSLLHFRTFIHGFALRSVFTPSVSHSSLKAKLRALWSPPGGWLQYRS